MKALAQGVAVVAAEAVRAGLDRVVPGGSDVPLRPSAVTPRWLEEVLRLPAGSVRGVRVVDEHSGTANRALIAIDAGPDANVPERLFLKLTPVNYLQHVMMLVFGLGTTEVLVYRALGDHPPVRVPRCFGARVDERRGRNIMLLEDLSPTARFRTVLDSVTADEAEGVVDALADLHIAFWESERFRGDLKPLCGRSEAINGMGDVVRRRFLGNMKREPAQLVPERMKADCRILFDRRPAVDAMWASQPQTLIHGDPHLGNLFFEGDRPGFIDWQVGARGSGMRDVAYFATASVDPVLLRSIERGLVERYAARLAAAGLVGPALDVDHLWNLYRAGITEFFVSAVAAAEAGERAQPLDITRAGVQRSVAGIEAHDSFGALRALVDGR